MPIKYRELLCFEMCFENLNYKKKTGSLEAIEKFLNRIPARNYTEAHCSTGGLTGIQKSW